MRFAADPRGFKLAITLEFDTQRERELVDGTCKLERAVTEPQAADWEPWLERGALGLRADGARRSERDDDDSDFDDFEDDDADEEEDLDDDLDDDDFGHDDLDEEFDEFDDHEDL